MKFFLFLILVEVTVKNEKNNYIALLDTDSKMKSNKINCTNKTLNHHYNHADQILDIINNKNILHFIIQDNNNQIKEEYIKCALEQLLLKHQASIILIPVNSYSGFSEGVYQLLFKIVEIYNIKIIIAKHPLNNINLIDSDNIIFIDRKEYYSSSEMVALYGMQL